jgi:hypothetical protein
MTAASVLRTPARNQNNGTLQNSLCYIQNYAEGGGKAVFAILFFAAESVIV